MSATPYLKAPTALDRHKMGKYDVLCRLSTGGMSEIFLAYQKGLAGFRKVVVLKSILPDIRGEEEFVRMFVAEAKTTALFSHPHIAQVYDLDVDDETLFLAMEFVQGCTLVEMARACRQAKEAIPIGFTLLAVRDTALALHYAHNFTDPRGRKKVVIHRDVAEKNIMVTYEGITKLLDFGIAKALGGLTARTTVGMVKGTSGYMSPEQIRGEPLDPRSDIFGLGVVLHECLTGMRLFHGKTPEEGMLSALREEVPPPSKLNPHVIPELDEVVLKALQRDREGRFSTALEFARAIEKAAMPQVWHPEQSGEWVQRHFSERVRQTRELIEAAQGGPGEVTGDLKLNQLLAELQGKDSSQNVRTDPGGLIADPLEKLEKKVQLHSVPTGHDRGARFSAPRSAPSVVTLNEVTGPSIPGNGIRPSSDEITGPPLILPVIEGETSGVSSHSKREDSNTIPEALIPSGGGNVPRTSAPPVHRPSMPQMVPPPFKGSQSESTESSRIPSNDTIDAIADEPSGEKTTVIRPFEQEEDDAEIRQQRLVAIGFGIFGAVAVLLLVMFALDWGPFAPRAKPAPKDKPRTAQPLKETAPKKEASKAPDLPAPEPRNVPKPVEDPTPKPDTVVTPEKTVMPDVNVPVPTRTAPQKVTKPTKPKSTARPTSTPSANERKAETVAENAAAPATGVLTLVTDPPGLLVSLDGNELGKTPLFNQTVPVGKRVFKLTSPKQETRSFPLEIKAGSNSTRLDFDSLNH